jgi:hypothetical protein
MANVNVMNISPNAVSLQLSTQVVDDHSAGDVVIQQKRTIGTGAPVILPGKGAITAVDSTFWSTWLSQHPFSTGLRSQLLQVS